MNKKGFWYWGPVVIWMAVIFLGSSHSNVMIGKSPNEDNLIKNLGHIIEYALLGFLMFRALFNQNRNSLASRYAWLWCLIGAILYGVSDEVHQIFVPTRTGYIGDVFIDAIGASVGLLFAMIVYTSFLGEFLGKFFLREIRKLVLRALKK